MEIYADMVKIHYEYFTNKDRYKKHIHSKFNEIEKYSDIDSMVFEKGDDIVVAMRGLQPSTPRDALIGTNIFLEDAYQQSGFDFESATKKKKGISILPNKYGEILKKEQNKIEELKKEYPNKKIVLAGHSRGGRKVIDLGEHNQLEYHAFQPAEMNRQANQLLSMGTNIVMGGVSKSAINKEMWKSLYGQNRVVNNLMFEFGSPMSIQNNVLQSAIQTDGYQPFANKFLTKTLTPTIIERSIEMVGGQNPLYEPIDFTRMPSNTYNIKSLNMIEPVVSFFKGEAKPQRKPPTESISNIYKTEKDVVSKFYEPTETIKPKHYAYVWWDHYLLGDHSINHFISKEMFDSVQNNKPIEEIEETKEEVVENNNLEPNFSPSPSISYKINSRELCKRYGSAYSPHCKKIFS